MPDLKLRTVLEAAAPARIGAALQAFCPSTDRPPRVVLSRLQAPLCIWLVYDVGGRTISFKSFFSKATYTAYLEQIRQHYAGRLGQPGHELGGIVPLPELNGLGWAFPFDPQMPRLPSSMDAGRVAELAGLPEQTTATLESYNPELAAIVAYRDADGKPVAFGKMSPNQAIGHRVFEAMRGLWRLPDCGSGRLRLAEPLAYDGDSGLLIQRRVPGRPLPDQRNSLAFMDLMAAAGRAAASIHNSSLDFGNRRLLEQETARLERALPELALTAPGLHSTLRTLLDQLHSRSTPDEPVDLVPCHGDFKWNQFLASRGRFSLIDFELCCQAERWLDAGYFCAYMVPTSPSNWRESVAVEMLRAAFLEEYAAASGVPVELSRLALYEAIALALRAMTQVWHHQGSWHLRASSLLDLAIDRLIDPAPKRLPGMPAAA